jgi:hypothetical protein
MSVLCYNFSYSQIYEVGVFVGGSNFIGDVGATNYISPNQAAIGGILKWNRSPRHSYRLSIIYTQLEAEDTKADDPRRQQRGLSFNNNLLEISAGMEFTFFDFDLHSSGKKITPYLFSGISAANFDNFYFNNSTRIEENISSWAFGIPIVLGVKARLKEHFIIALEIGARFTFTDELDGSIPNETALQPNFSFGNLNNNDWYTFSGITLTYTFGRNPCYCAQ